MPYQLRTCIQLVKSHMNGNYLPDPSGVEKSIRLVTKSAILWARNRGLDCNVILLLQSCHSMTSDDGWDTYRCAVYIFSSTSKPCTLLLVFRPVHMCLSMRNKYGEQSQFLGAYYCLIIEITSEIGWSFCQLSMNSYTHSISSSTQKNTWQITCH